MYWEACRKMASSVPGAISPCIGTVKVCFSPAGPRRRSLAWLPRCEITLNPKCSKTLRTCCPESRRSLGDTDWRLQLYGHQQRRIWLQAELGRVLAFQMQTHGFLEVRDGFVQCLTLGDDVDAHALGDVVRLAPVNERLDGLLHCPSPLDQVTESHYPAQ